MKTDRANQSQIRQMMHDSQILPLSNVIVPFQQQLKFCNFEHKIKLFVKKYSGGTR